MNAASAGPAGSPASTIVTVPLNDPGEGLTEAEILDIKVAVGDRVEINAPVVEVETAKSAVELSTHVAGTVVAILVAVGDEVPVGTGLIQVDTSGDPAPAPTGAADGSETDPSAEEVAEQVAAPAEAPAAAAGTEEPKNLVGYGSRSAPARRTGPVGGRRTGPDRPDP
ncbi:MAG: 2-oxo acid dehydrogenase subunit E2, partial [Brachybacterium sp.]|nr:2-oxo acid dehydrogenase subunit E2 [Brachybacterium sp.]